MAKAHPEPINYLFCGEHYGAELACQVGGLFVPLGGRILGADGDGLGGLSGRAIRDDPWGHWRYLPAPVRNEYALTVCLHGVESVGKSMLAERLAAHYGTLLVPEYGRAHCELYGTDCREKDLLLIVKSARGEHVGARLSRIDPNELYLQIRDGAATADVMIPFNEIYEVQIRPVGV